MAQGPQNVIVGDESSAVEIPQAVVVDEGYEEIKKAARFAKSQEFADLKKHFTERIAFYQVYLPNGEPIVSLVGTKTKEEIGNDWVVANALIAEFKAVIDVYERAADVVKENAER